MNQSNMDATTAEHGPPPHLSAGFHRTGSMESTEHLSRRPMEGMKSPPGPYQRGFPYQSSNFAATRSPRQIQSVVTTSFSMEEDRDYRGPMDHESRYAPHYSRSPPQGRELPHYGRELPPVHEHHELDGDRRDSAPHDMPRPRTSRVPPSPRGAPGDHPQHLHRSYSAGGVPPSYRSPGSMKRSFWHHAKSNDEFQPSLPSEFMPPKRAKVNPTRKEFVVTARLHPEEMSPSERHTSGPSRPPANYFNRATSWEAREEYYHRAPSGKPYPGSWSRHSPPSYREGDAGPHWSDAPPMPSPHGHYSPSEGGQYDAPWNQSRGWQQPHPDDHPWGPPPQYRDEVDSRHGWVDSREGYHGGVRRQSTFESGSETGSYLQPDVRGMGAQRRSYPPSHGAPDVREESPPHMDSKSEPTRLLALPEDRISLSETLCVVRENVEVFTATLHDVEAPAPGRKHAVVVGQVGLRCIHCRHTTRSSERVKRAVCYPSSIKRIYRTVIDMKLDHFLHCKFVPEILKETLNALKANNTRSTGTTMQYFIKAATSLGMVDGPNGVRLVESTQNAPVPLSPPMSLQKSIGGLSPPGGGKCSPSYSPSKGKEGTPQLNHNNSMSSQSTSNSSAVIDDPKETFTGKISLAVPEDLMSLSPLRCFLREQVCAFSASEEDIAVRTPTTFSVSVGQVGIGCVHCLNQPAKLRLNRAVCFPFSITRIYQSVADIQRFHFGECKMVPPDVKEKFLALQSASSKGSKGLATRQYWVSSAKKVGLLDTSLGIRFGRDPSVPETKSIFLDILAQAASSVTTVKKPLVLPEDKPFIADFLYIVMDQLQPCRFTEADRNKRRLKDVGCIGVECKHCAGQVDSRKFFWSSVNAVESNFVSVHTHMMECKMIPEPLKAQLAELKGLRKEQTTALKTGSQKAFFSRVWNRLHSDDKQQKLQLQQQAAAQEGASKSETTPPSPSAAGASPTASPKKEEIEAPASPSSSPISSAFEKMEDENSQMMDIVSV